MTSDDVDYAKRMHPEDRKALLDALALGSQAVPPGRPPADLTGRDAEMFRRIVQEEISRDREQLLKDCRGMIHSEVEDLFDETLPARFALIGLRIDNPDKIEETRRMLDDLRRAQQTAGEFKKEAFSQVLKAFGYWVGGAVAAGLAYLGLKGGSH